MLVFKVPQCNLERSLLASTTNRQRNHVQVWQMGVHNSAQSNTKMFLYHDRFEYAGPECMYRVKSGLVPVLAMTSVGISHEVLRMFLMQMSSLPVEAGLLFVTSQNNMQVFCTLKSNQDVNGPAVLSVPGPYMEKIAITRINGQPGPGGEVQTADAQTEAQTGTADINSDEFRRRYDRLAGGLGMGNVELGFQLLAKARRLVVVVVGCGRAGSWLAFRLAQEMVGADGALILIDPDTMEIWNLDGTFAVEEGVGLPKPMAVGGTVEGMTRHPRLRWVNGSITDEVVLDLLGVADGLFTCADVQAPRLTGGVIASRYHLFHIDLTGGYAGTPPRRVAVGGELRVHNAGMPGCVVCYDRYDWPNVLRLVGLNGAAERERRQGVDWRGDKAGSNVDVLFPVIGEALQAFWGILRGDIKDSFWLHYEHDRKGRPVWSDRSEDNRFRWPGRCAVCGEQAGLGDLVM